MSRLITGKWQHANQILTRWLREKHLMISTFLVLCPVAKSKIIRRYVRSYRAFQILEIGSEGISDPRSQIIACASASSFQLLGWGFMFCFMAVGGTRGLDWMLRTKFKSSSSVFEQPSSLSCMSTHISIRLCPNAAPFRITVFCATVPTQGHHRGMLMDILATEDPLPSWKSVLPGSSARWCIELTTTLYNWGTEGSCGTTHLTPNCIDGPDGWLRTTK